MRPDILPAQSIHNFLGCGLKSHGKPHACKTRALTMQNHQSLPENECLRTLNQRCQLMMTHALLPMQLDVRG